MDHVIYAGYPAYKALPPDLIAIRHRSNHLLDQDAGARATRGSKDITISPAISYDVNKNVALRFFFDYRRQEPYVSTSFIVVNWEGGVTVRIKLE